MYMYIVEGECDANYEEKIREKLFYLELALGLHSSPYGGNCYETRRSKEASIEYLSLEGSRSIAPDD